MKMSRFIKFVIALVILSLVGTFLRKLIGFPEMPGWKHIVNALPYIGTGAFLQYYLIRHKYD